MTDPAAPVTLAARIDAEIALGGPMPIERYMRLCLTDPGAGYYGARDPLGADGDFVTAPEISQMFGEMAGVWIAAQWRALGAPDPVRLVELGPGRGTLMADALRVLGKVPGLLPASRLVLVETSAALIERQRARLADAHPRWTPEIAGLDEADADAPLIVIANEFFDALPIRQYQRRNRAWHERLVGLRDGRRAFGLSPVPADPGTVPAALDGAENGAIWETSPLAVATMAALARRLVAARGALLAIDYGYAGPRTGDTFQAVARHRFADPLESPGAADLTAHVDFAALAGAARVAGARPAPLVTQATFLEAMGITTRAKTLAAANPSRAEEIGAALKRLVGDAEMGTLFKVLCVYAGFDAPI